MQSLKAGSLRLLELFVLKEERLVYIYLSRYISEEKKHLMLPIETILAGL